MIRKSIFLLVISLFFGTLTWLFHFDQGYTDPAFLFFGVVSITSVVVLVNNLLHYTHSSIKGDVLHLKYLFSPNKSFRINEVEEWQEQRYYLRAQVRRTLVIFFSMGRRILISNRVDPTGFASVQGYLSKNLDHLDTSTARWLKQSRTLNFSVEQIFRSWSEPKMLATWWSPNDIAILTHEFNFRSNGLWIFTRHGMGGQSREVIEFIKVIPLEFVSWKEQNKPWLTSQVRLLSKGINQTEIQYEVFFPSIDSCVRYRNDCSNQINGVYERLNEELSRIYTSQ